MTLVKDKVVCMSNIIIRFKKKKKSLLWLVIAYGFMTFHLFQIKYTKNNQPISFSKLLENTTKKVIVIHCSAFVFSKCRGSYSVIYSQ